MRRALVVVHFTAALAATLASGIRAQTPPDYAARQIIVRPSRAQDGAALRAAVGASLVRRFETGAELWELGTVQVGAAVEQLQHDARVERVEPNFIIRAHDLVPDDPRFPQQWGLHNTGQSSGKLDADIDAPSAWSITTGEPVLIGVIDSGVDAQHPDLAGAIYTNPGEITGNGVDDDQNGLVDDVHGWDFAFNDNDPNDANGHGTLVAGIIAARGNDGVGTAGISWAARILPIRILDSDGLGTVADAVRAVEYATRMGVRLANASWGGFTQSYALRDAIEAANQEGILFVASAGNDGRDSDRFPVYPAAYALDNIVSVASTDRNDAPSAFSNFGAVSVDLAAPGTGIISTFPFSTWASASGTSMSAAFVSGAACLLLGRAPLLTHREVKAALLASVEPVPGLAGQMQTEGRLNVHRLFSGLDAVAPAPVSGLSVTSASSRTVRLAWTASGDDGATGTARRYDLRYARYPIHANNARFAFRVADMPPPRHAGSYESFEVGGLDFLVTYYFALVVEDEAGNRSVLSNVTSATTLGVPQLDYSPDSFAATLPAGGTSSKLLIVRNEGSGTLDYTAVETPPWVELEPPSGRVMAGQPAEATVRFNAAGLSAGVYTGAILLATDAPGQLAVQLPVSLQVTSAPDIAVSARVLHFGSRFGPCVSDSLFVSNRGTSMLVVSGVQVTDLPFFTNPVAFQLGPDETRPLPVGFCPFDPGRFSATLTLTSNDPDHPVVSVALLGRTVDPPAGEVTPPAVAAGVYSGGTAARTVSISNTGIADLEYQIAIVPGEGATNVKVTGAQAPPGDVVAVGRPLSRDELQKLRASIPAQLPEAVDEIDATTGAVSRALVAPGVLPIVNGARLEEVFGSRQNRFLGGPRMRGNFYSCARATNLREHRFYLDPVGAGNIWLLVFESMTPSGVYMLISGSDIGTAGDQAGWYSSGAVQVPLQVGRFYLITALFESISEYYLQSSIAPYPVPASFGELIGGAGVTWNPIATFPPQPFQFVPPAALGEPVAYYQTLITDGVVAWATVDRGSGTVRRGKSVDLDLQLRAAPGFPEGIHSASLRITTNDPARPETIVPVQLTVTGAADIGFSQRDLDFGECFIGHGAVDTVVISNGGTETLHIAGVAGSPAVFTVNGSAFSLVPNENIHIPVTFTPVSAGPVAGSLTITSDDPDERVAVVGLRGRGVYPPEMTLSAHALDEAMPPRSLAARTMSIVNAGSASLSFSIDANTTAGAPGAAPASSRPPSPAISRDVTPAGAGRARASDSRSYSGRSFERPTVTTVAASGSDGSLRVLVLHASLIQDIRNALLGFAGVSVVDEFDASVVTPDLATLAGYDAVVVINEIPFGSPSGVGDVLADYVDQGGGVVVTLASYIFDYEMTGRWLDDGYNPFSHGPGPSGSASLGTFDTGHALMQGVTAASGSLLGAIILEPEARWVADWNNGLPFVATRGDRVVAINAFLADGGFWSGDIARLVFNAVRWVSRTTWLRAAPDRGVVPPNGRADITLWFDSNHLETGDHVATLRIMSNDPAARIVSLPVTLSVDSTRTTGVAEGGVPARYALLPNHPNPFNPSTTMAYDLPRASDVRLVVYDVSGRQVRELVRTRRPAGRHSLVWDGRDDSNRPAASGVYFCRLTAGEFVQTRKMILLK